MIRSQCRTGRADTVAIPETRGSTEIGSDFEAVAEEFVLPSEQSPPWEEENLFRYVESGRQALAAVEQHLRHQGHRTLFVPGYLCDSMIQPFVDQAWSVIPLPVGPDLAVDSTTLAQLSAGVLLHAKYFGSIESEQDTEALCFARSRGIVVVSDETHRVFSSSCEESDFRISSLRKLLPIPHGGYVWGLPNETSLAPPQASAALVLRRLAMATKSQALRSANSGGRHRQLFRAAEDLLVARSAPTELTEDIIHDIRSLDFARLRSQRLQNAEILLGALIEHPEFDIINPPSQHLTPSHLLLRTENPRPLREHLRQRRIYCPIHWPPSRLLSMDLWPEQYLSIPVDHRYTGSDMTAVAMAINDYFSCLPRYKRSVSDSRT